MDPHVWTHPYYEGDGDGPPMQHCSWCGTLRRPDIETCPCPKRPTVTDEPSDAPPSKAEIARSFKTILSLVPEHLRATLTARTETATTPGSFASIMYLAGLVTDVETAIAAANAEDTIPAARRLAGRLFSEPECLLKTTRCLEREEMRDLQPGERQKGWSRRPFAAYVPDNMCLPCRAYWHAEMAAQALERHDAIQKRRAAERAAKHGANG